MFKTVKRIIDWCGDFKGRLYIGFVFSFFSTWFAALPVMVAAYTISMLIEAARGGKAFETKWIGLSIAIIAAFVFLRFYLPIYRRGFRKQLATSWWRGTDWQSERR